MLGIRNVRWVRLLSLLLQILRTRLQECTKLQFVAYYQKRTKTFEDGGDGSGGGGGRTP